MSTSISDISSAKGVQINLTNGIAHLNTSIIHDDNYSGNKLFDNFATSINEKYDDESSSSSSSDDEKSNDGDAKTNDGDAKKKSKDGKAKTNTRKRRKARCKLSVCTSCQLLLS
jgi:hypothetical protein